MDSRLSVPKECYRYGSRAQHPQTTPPFCYPRIIYLPLGDGTRGHGEDFGAGAGEKVDVIGGTLDSHLKKTKKLAAGWVPVVVETAEIAGIDRRA
jgi:hypothetical protein